MPALLILLGINFVIYLTRGSKGATESRAPSRFGWALYVRWGVAVALTSSLVGYLPNHGNEPVRMLAACLYWFVGFVLLVYPEFLICHVLVPLGIPNVSMWSALLLRPSTVGGEEDSGALFFELLTRVRRGYGLDTESRAKLRDHPLHIPFTDATVRGVTLCTMAMEHAVEGRLPKARAFFRVVAELPPGHASRLIRCYAQGFLIADAAERGAWQEVLRGSNLGPRTRRAAFFGRTARRLLGTVPRPTVFGLKLAWLLASDRSAHRQLLERAIAASERPPQLAGPATLGEALQRLSCYSQATDSPATRAELLRLGEFFERALSPGGEVEELVRERCTALGGHVEPETILATLEAEIRELLGSAWEHASWTAVSLESPPDCIYLALNSRVSERLAELEALCGALPRGEAPVMLGLEDYWNDWVSVRELIVDFVRIYPERRVDLSNAIGSVVLNHGVWAHNQGEFYGLAYDVFRVARVAYEAEGDQGENAKLAKNNMALSAKASGAAFSSLGRTAILVTVAFAAWGFAQGCVRAAHNSEPIARSAPTSESREPSPPRQETPRNHDASDWVDDAAPTSSAFVTVKSAFGEFSSALDEGLDAALTSHFGPPHAGEPSPTQAASAPVEVLLGYAGTFRDIRLLFEGLESRGYVELVLLPTGRHLVWDSKRYTSPGLPRGRTQTLRVTFQRSGLYIEQIAADGVTILERRSCAGAAPQELTLAGVPAEWASYGRDTPVRLTLADDAALEQLLTFLEWMDRYGGSPAVWAILEH